MKVTERRTLTWTFSPNILRKLLNCRLPGNSPGSLPRTPFPGLILVSRPSFSARNTGKQSSSLFSPSVSVCPLRLELELELELAPFPDIGWSSLGRAHAVARPKQPSGWPP